MQNNHAPKTQKNTATPNKLKQLKPRFGRLLQPPAGKRSGPVLKVQAK